jgi:hypothetical protein
MTRDGSPVSCAAFRCYVYSRMRVNVRTWFLTANEVSARKWGTDSTTFVIFGQSKAVTKKLLAWYLDC